MPYTTDEHKKVAGHMSRDAEGHFVHTDPPPAADAKSHQNKIIDLLQENVHYSKKQDDLLDLHVGNPLRKIIVLLEDIKKQKAFSFSIKGSLGIMGVLLVAGTFGILGVGNVLCDKGIQTKQGVLEALLYKDNENTSILNVIPFVSNFLVAPQVSRKILMESSGEILHVVGKNGVDLGMFVNRTVLLSGNYDTCSETLTVSDAAGVQLAPAQSP